MSEISPTVVYWVTRLDHIRVLLGSLAAIYFFVFCAAIIVIVTYKLYSSEIQSLKGYVKDVCYSSPYKTSREDLLKEVQKSVESINDQRGPIKITLRVFAFSVIGFFAFFSGCAFVPNTKEACAILVIPQIANSDIVQKELPKSVESIVKLANNYLEELAAKPQKGGEE